MKRSLLILGIGLIGISGTVSAETDTTKIPTLSSPKVINRGPILYLQAALSRDQEGWVELETMVDWKTRHRI